MFGVLLLNPTSWFGYLLWVSGKYFIYFYCIRILIDTHALCIRSTILIPNCTDYQQFLIGYSSNPILDLRAANWFSDNYPHNLHDASIVSQAQTGFQLLECTALYCAFECTALCCASECTALYCEVAYTALTLLENSSNSPRAVDPKPKTKNLEGHYCKFYCSIAIKNIELMHECCAQFLGKARMKHVK